MKMTKVPVIEPLEEYQKAWKRNWVNRRSREELVFKKCCDIKEIPGEPRRLAITQTSVKAPVTATIKNSQRV